MEISSPGSSNFSSVSSLNPTSTSPFLQTPNVHGRQTGALLHDGTSLVIRDLLGHHKLVMSLPALEVVQGFLGQEGTVPAVVEVAAIAEATDEEE